MDHPGFGIADQAGVVIHLDLCRPVAHLHQPQTERLRMREHFHEFACRIGVAHLASLRSVGMRRTLPHLIRP
jgi:hypothetical protein